MEGAATWMYEQDWLTASQGESSLMAMIHITDDAPSLMIKNVTIITGVGVSMINVELATTMDEDPEVSADIFISVVSILARAAFD